MLATVDRALNSSGNSQTIGKSGELPLQLFLSRYLPNTLSARSGHFVSPSGQLSPQIDILIIDSRYPLLAENNDGSVLAMLHSVIYCIEVKTNIRTTDLSKMQNNSKKIIGLANNEFTTTDGSHNISCVAFAYRSECRLETLAEAFFDIFVDESTHTDLYLLRVPDSDRIDKHTNGVLLHLEPFFNKDITGTGEWIPDEWIPTTDPMYTPLSDFYYRIIQNSYYDLESRNFTFGDIGAHIMKYMSWSTF